MLKFVTQAYTPLDKDIIREAWVAGDLKDQLGIQHRKRRKNQLADLEHSALYNGSMSEDGGYHPARGGNGEFDYAARTPGQGLSPLEAEPQNGTPPLIVTTPADEYDMRTPRGSHFGAGGQGSPGAGSYYSATDSSYFVQPQPQQRSPVMTSVNSSQLTVGAGGEYEMGQLARPVAHHVEGSVQSRASEQTFATAQSEPPWDVDDRSPHAI